jgi:DNA-directed RNA polymerase specialized sigma24 family protein
LLADPSLRSALLRFVRARVPPPEVEDIVQQTLTDALAASSAPDEAEELRKWVHGIARNKVVDFHRRAGREIVREPSPGEEVVADSAPHSARELLRWAEKELPDGAEAHSTLEWMLREGEGEKLEHIAEEANVPAPRVRQRVSRMRRHLRARWAQAAAAVVVLALVAFALYKLAGPRPEDIAREEAPPVTPEQRAAELRREAFEQCGGKQWQRCIETLDRAKALDPAGERDPRVEQARAAAATALEPKSEPTSLPEQQKEAPKLEEKKTAPKPKAAPITTDMPSNPPPPPQKTQLAPTTKGGKGKPQPAWESDIGLEKGGK